MRGNLKAIFIFGITFLQLNVNSQSIVSHEWGHGMPISGSTANDAVQNVISDASGNVYSTGYFSGTMNLDGSTTLTSAGARDIFISKFNSTGVLQWAKRIGSTGEDIGYGITLDPNGNIILCGYFNSTVDFDPGTGTSNLTANAPGLSESFVLKLNNSGDFIWAKDFDKSSSLYGDVAYSVETNSTGDVFLCGVFNGTMDSDPGPSVNNLVCLNTNTISGFVIRLTSAGNFTYSKMFTAISANCYPYKLAVDGSSNVIVAGWFNNAIDFDPGAGTQYSTSSGGSDDGFVFTLNSSGDYVAHFRIGGGSTDRITGLDIDGTGNIYVTGYFAGTVDFDPGAGTSNLSSSGSNADIFISKYSSSSILSWVNRIGGTGTDRSWDLRLGNNNDVLVAGEFLGTVSFGSISIAGNASTVDAFITGLDQNGNYKWAGHAGGTSIAIGNTVCATIETVFLGGMFEGTIDMDPTASSDNSTATGVRDPFLASWSYCNMPTTPSSITGSITVCEGSNPQYSVTNVPGYSYIWTLPNGWTGSSTTNSISTTPSATSGNIEVIAMNGCGQSTSSILSVAVNAVPTVFGNDVTICEGDHAELEASSSLGNVNWYDENTNGNLLLTGPIYITGNLFNDTIFYITGDNNGCETNPRFAINVTINPMPNATVSLNGIAISSNQTSATLYQWLDCNNSNSVINGETLQTYLPSQNGSYAVKVNLNGCVDTSICTIISTVGLNEWNNTNEISIYPNPASDFINIEIPESGTIRLMNINGEIILEKESTNSNFILDVSFLSNGIYILELRNDQFIHKNKITIQH